MNPDPDSPRQSHDPPPDARLRRAYRIHSPADFRRAFALRKSVADDRLVLYACPNGLPHPRLGLVVSRKVGRAVLRNRWKRLIREAFRLSRSDLPPGLDLVVIPRVGAVPQLAGLMRSLPRLAQRALRRLERSR